MKNTNQYSLFNNTAQTNPSMQCTPITPAMRQAINNTLGPLLDEKKKLVKQALNDMCQANSVLWKTNHNISVNPKTFHNAQSKDQDAEKRLNQFSIERDQITHLWNQFNNMHSLEEIQDSWQQNANLLGEMPEVCNKNYQHQPANQ